PVAFGKVDRELQAAWLTMDDERHPWPGPGDVVGSDHPAREQVAADCSGVCRARRRSVEAGVDEVDTGDERAGPERDRAPVVAVDDDGDTGACRTERTAFAHRQVTARVVHDG